jgi:phosphohistidine phosphatase SixA
MKTWSAGVCLAGLIVAGIAALGAEKKAAPRKAPTIVALVRHAEKEAQGKDPGLTAAGKKRAIRLAELFGKAKLDLLVASDLRRTRETLEPLAGSLRMEIASMAEPRKVVEALKALPPGSVALVCHHSNTVDQIAKGLGVPDVEMESIPLDAYDNLLIVAFQAGQEPRLLHLSY